MSVVVALIRRVYKRCRKHFKKYVIWIASIGTLLIIFIGGSLILAAHLSLAQKFPQEADDYALFVEPGDNLIGVLNELYAEGLINSPTRIRVWMRLLSKSSIVRIGEYQLKSGMTHRDFLNRLAKGEQTAYSIQILNGSTFKDLYDEIFAHPKIKRTLMDRTPEEIMRLLGSDYAHPEGMFYADTYYFHRDETDLSILRRAHERMKRVLAEEWSARRSGLPYKVPYQALILASIVEKETSLERERPLIAGVFVNRLKRGMRLQADPTVIYGMGENYKGNIRRRDLLQRTPYNTYVVYGLPPTPIALMDRRAVRAALQPTATDYLFFVAKGKGAREHYFSTTFEEHEKAVQKYQLGR